MNLNMNMSMISILSHQVEPPGGFPMKAPGAVQPGDVVHAWRSPAIAEAAVAKGIDVVTSHGYYLTAGDGVDVD